MCGVTTTLSIRHSGWLGGSGSLSKTSRTAPAMRRCSSASSSAASFTTAARAMLMRQAVGFMAPSSSAPTIPRVSAVRGRSSTTKSACAIARAMAPTLYMRAASRTGRPRRETPSTRIPSPRAMRAMSRPMSPRPTIAMVLPPSRSGSTWSSQRRWRWASRYTFIRCVTQEHQPRTYSAIPGPKTPGARVTGAARQPIATARHVVVRVPPSIEPISSVTRRPTASRVGPSTTAMKSKGPVTASRLTTVESLPSIDASSFFTAFVLPGAVSMRTYARIFFCPPLAMWCLLPRPSALRGADRVDQRRTELRAPLDELRPFEIDPRATVVTVVRGIEGCSEPGDRRTDLQGQGLAGALVAQTRDDQEEALRVGRREIREAGLVADELDLAAAERVAPGVLHEAEDHVPVIHLVLRSHRRAGQRQHHEQNERHGPRHAAQSSRYARSSDRWHRASSGQPQSSVTRPAFA